MRRIGSVGFFCLAAVCGCGDTAKTNTSSASAQKEAAVVKAGQPVNILCSFFPMYIFTKNIVGDTKDVTVSLMVPAQTGCPHEYDLTPVDRKKIADATIFVMNGAGLEEFSEKQVKTANDKVQIVDSSIKVAKAGGGHDDHDGHDHKEHAAKEKAEHKDHDDKDGHKHDHDDKAHKHDHDEKAHKHDDHKHDDHDHHHHGGANPHFFSSPHQASVQVETIAEALAKLDPSRADVYSKNGKAYAAKLKALDEEFHKKSASFASKKIVTMHEVFDYLAADLGLEIVDTIKSSPGQDPSTGEMAKLVRKLKDVKPAAIFTEPQYSEKVAETIAKDAGIPVEKLDPVASGPENPPLDYYETAMRKNLETLLRVLSEKPKSAQ